MPEGLAAGIRTPMRRLIIDMHTSGTQQIAPGVELEDRPLTGAAHKYGFAVTTDRLRQATGKLIPFHRPLHIFHAGLECHCLG